MHSQNPIVKSSGKLVFVWDNQFDGLRGTEISERKHGQVTEAQAFLVFGTLLPLLSLHLTFKGGVKSRIGCLMPFLYLLNHDEYSHAIRFVPIGIHSNIRRVTTSYP